MATYAVSSSLTTPAIPWWRTLAADATTGVFAATDNWTVYQSRRQEAYLYWSCPHYTFHLMYRIRKRYSPSKLSQEGRDKAAIVWSSWGDWQGSASEIAKTKKSGNIITTATAISFVDTTDYAKSYAEFDKWEVEVKVRAVDESTSTVSEWSSTTLRVLYSPKIKNLKVTRKTDGKLYMTLMPTWEREENSVEIKRRVSSSLKTATVSNLGSGTQTFAIPATVCSDVSAAATDISFYSVVYTTSDNTTATPPNASWVHNNIDNEQEESSEITIPDLEVDYYEDFSLLRIKLKDASTYSSILGSITFTTATDKTVSEDLDLDGGGWYTAHDGTSNKYAWYHYPIFDKPMTIRITCSDGSKYNTISYSVTISGRGLVWSCGDLSHIAQAAFNLGVDEDLTYSTECIKTALGTSPVMRYGTGSERIIKARCGSIKQGMRADTEIEMPRQTLTITNNTTKQTITKKSVKNTIWAPGTNKPTTATSANRIIERLREPHDWIFRGSGGVWFHVGVTGVNRSWDYSSQLDTVDVTMQEVDSE